VPRTSVVFYQDADGACPFLEWFSELPVKAQDKCFVRLERLRDLGHELRRPEADILRDGIHELRISFRGIHYRILYFFHGTVVTVITHGLVKERAVPAAEIDRAMARKKRFEANPSRHSYRET
jgi:phage-related protein